MLKPSIVIVKPVDKLLQYNYGGNINYDEMDMEDLENSEPTPTNVEYQWDHEQIEQN